MIKKNLVAIWQLAEGMKRIMDQLPVRELQSLLDGVGFGPANTENTWKIKVADRKSLLNLH